MSRVAQFLELKNPDTPGATTSWLSEQIHAACLVVLICWPYSLVDRQFSLAALFAVSAVAFLNQPLRLPRLAPLLLVFLGYFALVLALQALSGSLSAYSLSQSNHIIQFTIYYFAFAKIVQGCDWTAIISSKRFLIAAAVLSALYYWRFDAAAAGGDERDLNITMLGFLMGLFLRGRTRHRFAHFVAMTVVCAIIAIISNRSSVLLVLGFVLLLYWVRLPKYASWLVVGLILILPVAFYLLIDNQTVLWLYKLDHNTGIRAEFIRGGGYLLQQTPIFGVGFGVPYRPTNFPYLSSHRLLSDLDAVQTVSNHHSLFDVALRLGLPASALFYLGIFGKAPRRADSDIADVLSIVAAIGLSFNAAFENQHQLPQLALIIAMLHAGAATRPFRRLTTDKASDP